MNTESVFLALSTVLRELIDGAADDGAIASAAHLAYHLGAIRQINDQARGPREQERGI